jgi:hypothetical protein
LCYRATAEHQQALWSVCTDLGEVVDHERRRDLRVRPATAGVANII